MPLDLFLILNDIPSFFISCLHPMAAKTLFRREYFVEFGHPFHVMLNLLRNINRYVTRPVTHPLNCANLLTLRHMIFGRSYQIL
jgi:hypothetical protein